MQNYLAQGDVVLHLLVHSMCPSRFPGYVFVASVEFVAVQIYLDRESCVQSIIGCPSPRHLQNFFDLCLSPMHSVAKSFNHLCFQITYLTLDNQLKH